MGRRRSKTTANAEPVPCPAPLLAQVGEAGFGCSRDRSLLAGLGRLGQPWWARPSLEGARGELTQATQARPRSLAGGGKSRLSTLRLNFFTGASPLCAPLTTRQSVFKALDSSAALCLPVAASWCVSAPSPSPRRTPDYNWRSLRPTFAASQASQPRTFFLPFPSFLVAQLPIPFTCDPYQRLATTAISDLERRGLVVSKTLDALLRHSTHHHLATPARAPIRIVT